jgi:hypothetical protein
MPDFLGLTTRTKPYENRPRSARGSPFLPTLKPEDLLIFCEPDGATAKLLDGIVGVSIVDPRDTAQMDRALHDLYRRHAIEGVPNVPSDEDAAKFSRRRQSEVFVCLVERVRPYILQALRVENPVPNCSS